MALAFFEVEGGADADGALTKSAALTWLDTPSKSSAIKSERSRSNMAARYVFSPAVASDLSLRRLGKEGFYDARSRR